MPHARRSAIGSSVVGVRDISSDIRRKPSTNSSSSTPSLPPNREYTFIVLIPAAVAMRRTVSADGPSEASRSWAAASSAARVLVGPRGAARATVRTVDSAMGVSPYSAVSGVMWHMLSQCDNTVIATVIAVSDSEEP